MSDKYYPVEVNRAMLQEYLDISKMETTVQGAKVVEAKRREIRAHIFTEAFAAFAAEMAREEVAE